MEQESMVETLQTSLTTNIWVERHYILAFLIAGIGAVYLQFNLMKFLELFLGVFLFAGIFMLGFVAVAAHIQYYFHFERKRKVELFSDKIVISKNGTVLDQISKTDIIRIVLYDKLKNKSDFGGYNLWPSFADPFYYLEFMSISNETVVLTCLLDIKLKQKIAAWYGEAPEHKYQFFPFSSNRE